MRDEYMLDFEKKLGKAGIINIGVNLKDELQINDLDLFSYKGNEKTEENLSNIIKDVLMLIQRKRNENEFTCTDAHYILCTNNGVSIEFPSAILEVASNPDKLYQITHIEELTKLNQSKIELAKRFQE